MLKCARLRVGSKINFNNKILCFAKLNSLPLVTRTTGQSGNEKHHASAKKF
jgi:hypothetical protein